MEPHCDTSCKVDSENGRRDRTIQCEDRYDLPKGEKLCFCEKTANSPILLQLYKLSWKSVITCNDSLCTVSADVNTQNACNNRILLSWCCRPAWWNGFMVLKLESILIPLLPAKQNLREYCMEPFGLKFHSSSVNLIEKMYAYVAVCTL